MTRFVVVALLALTCLAGSSSVASAASCSDREFFSQRSASVRQMSMALDYMEMKSHRSAEAWALKSWRTLNAGPAPCQSSYRRWRQYQMSNAAAVWNATKAYRLGNLPGAIKLLEQAEHWTDLAGAEEANWD